VLDTSQLSSARFFWFFCGIKKGLVTTEKSPATTEYLPRGKFSDSARIQPMLAQHFRARAKKIILNEKQIARIIKPECSAVQCRAVHHGFGQFFAQPFSAADDAAWRK
jgi:hypothetical protein